MPTLIALWSMRLAIVAAAGVAAAAWAAGSTPLDAIDRGLLAAAVFTFGGRWLLDRLESPEARLLRLRSERAAARNGARGRRGTHGDAAAAPDTARGTVRAATGATEARA